ncbi:hypothetical protein [Pseudomonas sp. Irchel s3b2]|uniref:hypothetical protein n=1 Tax=Pseudomonas sp. Irchel s3b2 TaxID=2009073 RepID=UPI000BA2EF6F|nr:hypothetical protein [Pseudomonas sp. Irchel s3b2]
MESLLPFLLFAFVASITPGPTNILVLSHSSRLGLGATLPVIFGACVAAALIVFAVGLGVGETLLRFLLVSLPCMTLWALLGVGSARVFGSPQAFKRMNHALAFLLLVSAWLTVLM